MPPLRGAFKSEKQEGQYPRGPRRVGTIAAIFLIGMAVLFDATQFFLTFGHVIPFIGTMIAIIVPTFIGITAQIVLGIAFALCGVNFFTGKHTAKKVLSILGPMVTEFIPFLNMLPMTTASTVSMVVISRLEDKERDRKQATVRQHARALDERERRATLVRMSTEIEANESATEEAAVADVENIETSPKKPRDREPWEKIPRYAAEPSADLRDFR